MEQDKIDLNNIHLDYVAKNHAGVYPALYELVQDIYQDIMELDLRTESVFYLRCFDDPTQVGNYYPFVHETEIFCSHRIMVEDSSVAKHFLSLKEMRKFYDSGQKAKSMELRVCANNFMYEWVDLSIFSLPNIGDNSAKILITIRNINDQKLMKSIIDRFVYDSCDYFVYLDAKADSYIMFSGSSNGTPLPPSSGDSYSTEVVTYAHEFVAPDEQDSSIAQMEINHVLKMLEEHDEYIIYVGVIDPVRGYTRKCVKYRYCDRKNNMILLIRTDVTDVFMLEKEKSDQLRQALIEARTDSLTEIFNRKALETLISERLSSENITSTGAFFFIDIDNFKQINDQLGHGMGDYLLRHLSHELKNQTPKDSVVGRLGGDEFVVFCPQMCARADIEKIANTVCCAYDNVDDDSVHAVGISCSVGIALYPQDGSSYEDLYQNSDQALYVSKSKNKKQFTFFDKNINVT